MNTDYLTCYWGKADPAWSENQTWHPLAYHCLDVAASGQILLEHQPVWLQKLSDLSCVESNILRPWLLFLLAIHDIGKFADGFQQKRPDLQKQLKGNPTSVGGDTRHDTLGYVMAVNQLPAWLDQPQLGQRGGLMLRNWLSPVMGHPGRPPKSETSAALLLRNQCGGTVLDDAGHFVAASFCLFFGQNALPTLVQAKPDQASWLLSGLAVLADWLGSNTRWFPYRAPNIALEGKRSPPCLNSERRMAVLLTSRSKSGLQMWGGVNAYLEDYWNTVALPEALRAVEESGLMPASIASVRHTHNLFPHIQKPTALQSWAETTAIEKGPHLFVLEELTGGGKTEAALTLAARLMSKGFGQGVYLALPTMATADAMFDRLRHTDETGQPDWRRFFTEGHPQLMLAHSADRLKLRLEEMNRQDAGYPDGEEISASKNCTAWLADSRKKALLADFGIGTIDQALLSVLPVRHQSLRLLGLRSKILIVDEVHACDSYMGELLKRLLFFHARLGGSAILLSATLPREHRADYLQVFAEGAGYESRPTAAMLSAEYPLTTHCSSTGLKQMPCAARETSARRVRVERLDDRATVYARLQRTLERGGCAAWVRNSVADAIEAWTTWQTDHPEWPAILFHARFALTDRLATGQKILEAFGPDSTTNTRKGKLVIATQVIEQSLDVDFDDMVTDLAPIDLIIQRAGRLQRHCRDQTGMRLKNAQAGDGRGGACLGILAPEPVATAGSHWLSAFLPKTGKVYPDHGALWLTADWLERNKGFELPRQARDMIESVYDTGTVYDRIPEALQTVTDRADGTHRAAKATARGNLLVFKEGYCPTSEKWQEDIKTPTRISEVETVRVRLARTIGSTIGPWAKGDTDVAWALSDLNVPEYLVAGENAADTDALKSLRETMPDEGRYVIIIILEETEAGSGRWQGFALNRHDKQNRIFYSSIMGFMIDSGVNDESDQ